MRPADVAAKVRLLSNDSSDPDLLDIVECARTGLPDETVLELAYQLARSGVMLGRSDDFADIASTGGPTSLSTLLCPLFLREMGRRIPKLGVPGRPAGGIDVLGQIPGYRVDLDPKEVENVIERSGYVHFLATGQFAPLDLRLFEYRQAVGAQSVPDLAIASLLSKKLAVGVVGAGLDVRVARHGNFGTSWSVAREHATRFCCIGKMAGLDPTCFLTHAQTPYQPYVGRGETLLALEALFSGAADERLNAHADLCFAMAMSVAKFSGPRPSLAALRTSFIENLEAQGASETAFYEKTCSIKDQPRFELTSPSSGFVSIRLDTMRDVFVRLQKESVVDNEARFPDPCGAILRVQAGSYVQKDQPLASVRIRTGSWKQLRSELARAFLISNVPDVVAGFEEIR